VAPASVVAAPSAGAASLAVAAAEAAAVAGDQPPEPRRLWAFSRLIALFRTRP
jgi:hypothetical protein